MDVISRGVVDSDNPASVSARARRRRWARFLAEFPDIAQMRVLDLGGTPAYWRHAPCRPAAVTTVNIAAGESDDLVTAVQGDACDPPAAVRGDRFDLVVSNSLLEHVGGHAQRQRLAEVIRSSAQRHWVQTPYRYFPVEPHWLCPGIQFLPFRARVWVTERWPVGNMTGARTGGWATNAVHGIELLSRTEMRSYFPDSQLWMERWHGLPKSLVSIRGGLG